jgi:hypothetical protein
MAAEVGSSTSTPRNALISTRAGKRFVPSENGHATNRLLKCGLPRFLTSAFLRPSNRKLAVSRAGEFGVDAAVALRPDGLRSGRRLFKSLRIVTRRLTCLTQPAPVANITTTDRGATSYVEAVTCGASVGSSISFGGSSEVSSTRRPGSGNPAQPGVTRSPVPGHLGRVGRFRGTLEGVLAGCGRSVCLGRSGRDGSSRTRRCIHRRR